MVATHPDDGDPDATSPTPSARFARWMAQVDACPECLENLEPPRHVTPTRDGYEAYYRCTDCRHTWTTAWRDE